VFKARWQSEQNKKEKRGEKLRALTGEKERVDTIWVGEENSVREEK
jgi:hypothetical protein